MDVWVSTPVIYNMLSLVASKTATIRTSMRDSRIATSISRPIREVVLNLLNTLDSTKTKLTGGSETQKSSARTEHIVLEILNLPMIEKEASKRKTLFALPVYIGDYFGFKRAVERRSECRFAMPSVDGVYAVHQPYGSQANPDILLLDVRSNAIVSQFGIEIKSGDPTWNTHIQFADRSMLYIAFEKDIQYFFGEHVRDKESLILALAWDEIQRELADTLNEEARKNGLKNMCVPYPKQEFRGLNLSEGMDARHAEIKTWLTA
jgi:hypothetical protein